MEFMDRQTVRRRNQRVGLILTLVTLAYIGLVIGFIIAY